MTSSNWKHVLSALTLFVPLQTAWASLGEPVASVEADRMRMRASRARVVQANYSVHELTTPDGSHIRQFVGNTGEVFAVIWNTQYKPDLSQLLGSSFASYSEAAQLQARRGGIQRYFRHTSGDLIVQSRAHLHVFNGFAMRRSLMPAGFVPRNYGME
jgi:hypothetical protein